MTNQIKPPKERLKEFDIARVFAIICMVAVHTEFSIYNYKNAAFAKIFDYLGSPFAAPVFMFILGANICLSSKNTPKQLFVRGISIFALSVVFNVICHALPFFILDFINMKTSYIENALHWVFAVDILTFAGLTFLFFALIKAVQVKNWMIILIGIALSIINTILTDHCPIDFDAHPLWAAVTSVFYNSSVTGYFSFFSWIIFPIAGYIFIQILENVENRDRFYCYVGGVSLFAYLIMVFISFKWLPNLPLIVFEDEYAYYRMHPFDALGTVFFCLAWLGILHFVSKIFPTTLDKTVMRLNKNLTNIYLIQWFLINYCFVLPFNGTLKVGEWLYILCSLAVLVSSDLLAYGYEKYNEWKS